MLVAALALGIQLAGAVAIAVLLIAAWIVYRLARAPIPVRRPLRPLVINEAKEAVVLHGALDPSVAARLDRLFALIRHHYIWPWYSKLSTSTALPDAIEALVRKALLDATRRGSQVDWPDLIVSRIVPILKAHLEHYQAVQHLSGQLPLPPKPHPAFNQTVSVYLGHIVERAVQGLLPDQTAVVGTLVRELVLGMVLPVFDMLADGDFWNRQIDEKGGRYLYERWVRDQLG